MSLTWVAPRSSVAFTRNALGAWNSVAQWSRQYTTLLAVDVLRGASVKYVSHHPSLALRILADTTSRLSPSAPSVLYNPSDKAGPAPRGAGEGDRVPDAGEPCGPRGRPGGTPELAH